MITSNVVSLSPMSSFESDPPTFTLFGNTSGGPPVEMSWWRNGVPISNGPPFNITLDVAGNSGAEHLNSSYLSTLTVTGELPGVYVYRASNSATATPGLSGSFSIEGESVETIQCLHALSSHIVRAFLHDNFSMPRIVICFIFDSVLCEVHMMGIKQCRTVAGADPGGNGLASHPLPPPPPPDIKFR